jgi:hypothetical protein
MVFLHFNLAFELNCQALNIKCINLKQLLKNGRCYLLIYEKIYWYCGVGQTKRAEPSGLS